MQIIINQDSANDWRHCVNGGAMLATSGLLSVAAVYLQWNISRELFQFQADVNEALAWFEDRLDEYDKKRAQSQPKPKCSKTIICNNGEGCGRYTCPARTLTTRHFVRKIG